MRNPHGVPRRSPPPWVSFFSGSRLRLLGNPPPIRTDTPPHTLAQARPNAGKTTVDGDLTLRQSFTDDPHQRGFGECLAPLHNFAERHKTNRSGILNHKTKG